MAGAKLFKHIGSYRVQDSSVIQGNDHNLFLGLKRDSIEHQKQTHCAIVVKGVPNRVLKAAFLKGNASPLLQCQWVEEGEARNTRVSQTGLQKAYPIPKTISATGLRRYIQ